MGDSRTIWTIAGTVLFVCVWFFAFGNEGESELKITQVGIDNNSRTMTVVYLAAAPPCETNSRIVVKENDATVVLRAYGDKPDPGKCPALAKTTRTEVQLGAELGQRTVIDAASDTTVPVNRALR